MSIFGAVYYDRFAENRSTPDWFRAERYDFCEDAGQIRSGMGFAIMRKISSFFTM